MVSGITWVIKSRRMRQARYVAHTEEKRCAYRVLVGRPEGKRPLAIPWHRWENNIKWPFKGQALVNKVMMLHVPQNVGNFLTS